tara:strand:- start:2544 stop:3473 length:930 start_codon:yes stop_codon:yes gene_type:complete
MIKKLNESEIINSGNHGVSFGIAPINWSNDDMPELGGHYTLDTILSEMSQAGYSGTEIGNKFPKDSFGIKKALTNFNLELASSWHSTFFLSKNLHYELEKIKHKSSLLVEAGAKIINLAECSASVHGKINTPLSSKPVCNEKNWGILTESLNHAGEICNEHGISMAFHHHMGTCVQNENELNRLLSDTDPELVNLCADTGHLYFAGIDPVIFFKENMRRIKHIHFKDLRHDIFNNINFDKTSFLNAVLKGVFTVPGDGCIDFNSISKVIIKSEYNGWVIVEAEQNPDIANPFEYARKSKQYLNNIWRNY